MLAACRRGDLTARARCKVEFTRWLRSGKSEDFTDAPIDVTVGAMLDAESQWNLDQIRVTLQERLPSE